MNLLMQRKEKWPTNNLSTAIECYGRYIKVVSCSCAGILVFSVDFSLVCVIEVHL